MLAEIDKRLVSSPPTEQGTCSGIFLSGKMRGRRPRLEPLKGWNCRLVVIFPDGKIFFDDFQHSEMTEFIFHKMVLYWKEGQKY